MCRIAAYHGPEIAMAEVVLTPEHSLLCQSQNATEAKLAVNGDGFGLAWYATWSGAPKGPGLYRDVMPAWSDANLPSLCRMVRSPLFLAHVRASTIGETSRGNCHPFAFDRWSFCHNGQIPAFPDLRRALESTLPDPLYAARRGTTDSEMLFLTLLAEGLQQDPAGAIARVVTRLRPLPGAAPNRMTCVFSCGDTLYAFRHATDARAPTLYVSTTFQHGGYVLASEPLDGRVAGWDMLPPDTLVRVGKHGLEMTPLFQAAA